MPTKPKPKTDTPNPGSDAALNLGCRCPVMDNGYGRGSLYGKDVFVMYGHCPLHGGTAISEATKRGRKPHAKKKTS